MDAAAYLAKISEQTFFRDEKSRGSLRWLIEWYRSRAPIRRFLFRATGMAALIISISLPFFLGVTEEPEKARAATIAAWAIALLTGLNGFFGWDKVWQSYMHAQLTLESLLRVWEVQSSSLALTGGPDAINDLDKLARSTVTEAMKAVIQETGNYFSNVQFPDLKPEAK